MEWIGLVCLGLILCYSGYPGRVKTLESKVKKLEKKNAALSRTNFDAKNRSAEGALKMSSAALAIISESFAKKRRSGTISVRLKTKIYAVPIVLCTALRY